MLPATEEEKEYVISYYLSQSPDGDRLVPAEGAFGIRSSITAMTCGMFT